MRMLFTQIVALLLGLALVVATACAAGLAHAPTGHAPDPCESKEPGPLHKPTDPDYAQGITALRAGRWLEGIAAFEKSYASTPNARTSYLLAYANAQVTGNAGVTVRWARLALTNQDALPQKYRAGDAALLAWAFAIFEQTTAPPPMPATHDVDLQRAWLEHPFFDEFTADNALMAREAAPVGDLYLRTQKATEEAVSRAKEVCARPPTISDCPTGRPVLPSAPLVCVPPE